MTYSPPKLLTFEQFLVEYGDNPRYELIDGELRDMEPTGPHEEVAGNIAGRIYTEILLGNFNWLIPKTCLIKPPAAQATALRPDIIVLDKATLSQEPLWQKEPIICNGNTIKLVAEVVSQCVARVLRVEATDEPVRVSSNWQDDYARKVEEYAFLEIPEYWIVDFRGLGGLQFIGSPKQPTFTVCQLVNGVYQQQKYHLGDTIVSGLFPNLQLKLDDVMPC
ncbi:Uma2 family endonuclease [Okeanomitos corallinicola TIOX110]|uniref:Uma2 family endonuclease n=1 Tax=Okeanomitos corallinicola TIOX110 TaxID=3133117 RepID=A0ABZ2ULD9_9CYAN